MDRRGSISLVLLLGLMFWLGPCAAEPGEIRIGVLAKRGIDTALDQWGPTADYLDSRLPGRHFRIVPMGFDDIPLLVDNALVDFVIVNPAIYVDLAVKFGVRRLATLDNRLSSDTDLTRFGSVVFVRADTDAVQGLADLPGRRVDAVHETSLGGWIMALGALDEAGIEPAAFSRLRFLGTHDAVVRSVLRGDADVGVVRTDTLERMADEGTIDLSRLRVIRPRQHEGFPFAVSTVLYPEWPVAKLRHTPDDLARDVAIALMGLRAEQVAARASRIGGWTIPENYQPVHELLERLRLPPYEHFGRITPAAVLEAYWAALLAVALGILLLLGLIVRIARLNRCLSVREVALRRSEQQARATFDHAAVGILHATPTGRILRVNRRLCEMTGYSEIELTRLGLDDITHPDDRVEELARFAAMQRGETDQFTCQQRYVRKDNGPVWVLLTVSAVRDDDEALDFLVAVVDDIGQIKALEQELEQTRQRQDLILDIAGDGILGLDRDARHSFVNTAAAGLLGYEKEEMLGQGAHAMWHHTREDGSAFPESDCPITAVLRDGRTYRGVDGLFWRKDGTALRARYASTPVIREGRVEGAVVVFRPIESESLPGIESADRVASDPVTAAD